MLRLCCSHMSQLKMLRQQMPLRNFKLPNSPSILQHSGCPLHMRPHVHARAGFSILRQVGPQLHHVARPGSSSLPLRPVCHSVEPTSDSDYLPLAPAIYEGSPTYDDILTPPLQGSIWGMSASDALRSWCCNVLSWQVLLGSSAVGRYSFVGWGVALHHCFLSCTQRT